MMMSIVNVAAAAAMNSGATAEEVSAAVEMANESADADCRQVVHCSCRLPLDSE